MIMGRIPWIFKAKTLEGFKKEINEREIEIP
jgi:hypothetical protein